ncbi:band 7 protein AGAP004871-like [Galleria mellonella]|uniref:Band 7 protein AGAP004871-like n=1 Tax=Galleria mellonella TaxID=7137 RepID=A0A6J3C9Y2_GALME|nr:band 7 protein AGAP004871-like [Galleria mellonella]
MTNNLNFGVNTSQDNISYNKINKDAEKSKDEDPTKERSVSIDYSDRRVLRMQHKEDDKLIEKVLVFMSIILVIITFPLSLLCVFVTVRQFERAIILRNGKVHKNRAFGPGLICYLPCVDTIKFTDLRIICYAVPPQEALTKDSLTVAVDAVIYYKIYNPVRAVINVADYKMATQYLAATTLRNALGTTKLSELLLNRPTVSFQIFQQMKNITREWGIQVVRVEIKDISLPLQLQKAMAAEAESSRLANAKIIVAKAEIESTKNLQIATKLLMDNPLCMQLRYLQSLHMIAGDQTHTIVLPFSAETLKNIFK